MKIWIIFFALVTSTPLFADDSAKIRHLSGAGQNPEIDAIRYSDNADFDPKLVKYLSGAPRFIENWEGVISLPRPPDNSSPRTASEIAYLERLEAARTSEQEADVRQQIKVAGMTLGTFRMGKIQVVAPSHPATKRMLDAAQRDMELIVFQLKNRFDRARPNHLSAEIVPSITVPGHPAYPSGHATQAHLLAYLLMELAPDQSDALVRDAAQIARNREIAGVHYPSDSEAGQLLARQIVDVLLKNSQFRSMLDAAKLEFKVVSAQ